jgi:excisionase family DNA binding protein
VKNTLKNRPLPDSLSAAEAAARLGVSIPTVKRDVAEGRLEGFRTPGGHLRILAESVEAVRQQRPAARPLRDVSPALQNRRDRLEELNMDIQEHRTRRELAKLRAEDQEEADRCRAEAEAREREAAQRQAEIELERERLKFEKAQERTRQQQAEAEQWEKERAARELAAFHCGWQEKASEALYAYQYRWLSPTQRKEIIEALEAEIEERQPMDEPRMPAIIARTLEALIEPLRAERDAQERRQRLTDEALRSVPYGATEAEKVRASAAIREALGRFDNLGDLKALRVATEEAVQPICQAVERRLLDERVLFWATVQLPYGWTDADKAQLRRECAEILAELPKDITEAEAKQALDTTIWEARAEIEQRQGEKNRQARKAILIQQGVAEVSSYLLELKRQGEITDKEWLDSGFAAELQTAVKRRLEEKLSGNETAEQVQGKVRAIIDAKLG